VNEQRRSRYRWRTVLAGVAAILAIAAAGCSDAGRGTASPATSARPLITATTSSTIASAAAAAAATVGPVRVLYHGDSGRRSVALTLDAGSDAGFTASILATLRREGIRATFSITGLWAEQNRGQLLAIAAGGHQIINHSYDHASFTGFSTGRPPLTAAERALELSRTETTVYHLSQRSTRPYFRPPYGDIDAGVKRDAAAAGYGVIVMWSVDSLGWQGAPADAIVERCLAQAAPGAIYVMHVGSESRDAAALPRVIAGLRAAGYGFETVDELVRN
jgi:peptidoglycan/xylan/chitin deacetylase (PgdA/CDA1 family)